MRYNIVFCLATIAVPALAFGADRQQDSHLVARAEGGGNGRQEMYFTGKPVDDRNTKVFDFQPASRPQTPIDDEPSKQAELENAKLQNANLKSGFDWDSSSSEEGESADPKANAEAERRRKQAEENAKMGSHFDADEEQKKKGGKKEKIKNFFKIGGSSKKDNGKDKRDLDGPEFAPLGRRAADTLTVAQRYLVARNDLLVHMEALSRRGVEAGDVE